ncbi:helix-turn-helix transcriptional regulator [Kribbella sp. NPDC051952]|uniref:helix-turn-helix domain-containing protein n=1 Tax=Kribbella sp. NPDC051952 TaxID=3154851 RepID=UPI00343085BC
MSTSPNSAARKAQEALGLRLRELRREAGLTGRALAAAAGWHFTRVSKIENGVQAPTDLDIRVWCAACEAEEQVGDLIAQARSIQSMYMEFRHRTRSGMKQLMLSPIPLYERTAQFRIYEHNAIPGIFQTPSYARAMLTFWFGFLNIQNDLDESVAARMQRQAVLYQTTKTFAVVLEEAALYTRFGRQDAMAGQLDRLLTVMTMPNISLGIVPRTVDREVIGTAGFWMFDDKLVKLETPTASIEVSQPQEIALYARMFDTLREPAVYGREARRLIVKAQDEISQHPAT